MTEMHGQVGPARLVYGLWLDESFAVVDESWAQKVVAEIRAWEQVSTVGEFRELAARSDLVIGPPAPVDNLEGYAADAPYDPRDEGTVADGDWPPTPTIETLRFLPTGWGIGSVEATMHNGDLVWIGPDEEPALVAAAQLAGTELARDDELIAGFELR